MLQGCAVLDCTGRLGWLAGRLLGDLGADVLKIEPPDAALEDAALEDADWRAVGDITVYYDATQTAPSVLHASLVTGKNWLRLLEGLYQQAGLSALRQRLLAEKLPLHFTIVFALSLKRVGFSLEQAKRLLLFQSLRDQVSAAVRLGLVGPLEAARRLRSLNEYGEAALARSGARCYRQAYRCVPQLDIAQGMHGYLYSRLFQS